MAEMNILDSEIYISDLKKALSGLDLSELKNKSILITGGLGLICSAIVDLLIVADKKLDLNIVVYVAARNKTKFDERYQKFPNVHFVEYDALKPVDFGFSVDYIIYGAGVTTPDKFVSEPVETMLSNINGVKNILEYAKQKGAKRVLYISSSEIYGKKETDAPFVENVYGTIDLDSIRSCYGVAKQASELLCKSYLSEYSVDTVIVRPGHVFGPTASKTDKRISSDFVFKAACGISLEMKSSGLQKRSYCYSVDVAAAILMVLMKGRSGETYNICTDEVVTIREMSDICAKAGNVSLSYVEPTKEEVSAFNPMNNSSLSFEKLEQIGFRASFTVEEGLKHTVEILRGALSI